MRSPGGKTASTVHATFLLLLSAPYLGGFEEVWRRSYEPSPGGNEEGRLIAADATGNVYAAGTAEDLEDNYDVIVVLKHSPGGEILWTQSLSGPELGAIPVALQVDGAGAAHVLVAEREDDYERSRFVKYGRDGELIGSDGFHGFPVPGEDAYPSAYPEALLVTPGGSAFVLASAVSQSGQTLALMRYGPGGDRLWLAARTGRTDRGGALAIDTEGNLIVAATSSGLLVAGYGQEDGVERFSHVSELAVTPSIAALTAGPDGSLYAAGASVEAGLVAVLRLDARGRLLGSTVMARGDVAGFTGLEVSPAGEVYVAGHAAAAGRSSGFLSRLGPTLDLVWSSDALGEGEHPLVKDFLRGPDGLLHLAGSVGTGSSSDAWTAAFDASGVRVREIRRDGGRDDGAAALAIDPAGNIHVTGSSFGRNSPDLLTVSYGPDGRERWAARYLRPERTQIHRVLADGESALVAGGSGRYGDLIRYGAGGEVQWDLTFRLEDGFDLALDPGGDVLLAAGALQRIDPAGVRLWTRGEPPSYEKVQVDAVGSIYAAGFERNERGVRQPTLAKLDPSGTEVWRRVLFLEGTVQGLALDPAGLPIFTDARNRTVFKYDAAGEVIWSTKLPDRFTGVRVAADASGAVYVGGNGVVKLDPAGNLLWGEPTSNVWRDMLLDPAGRVYAIDSQQALLELTPDGSEVWRSSELGWIERIFLDASGGLYVSGANPGMDRPDTYFVSRIEPGGRVADRIEFGPARFGPGQPVLGFLSSGDLIAAAPSEERYAIIRLRTVPGAEFVRGDANEDGRVLMDDAIGTLDWLFRGGSAPACPDASDVNDDGRNDISDPIYTLTHLYLGGPAPPAPHPGKGPDPSLDSLGCSG